MDRADLERPECRAVCAELDALIADLDRRGLRVSNWYGALEMPLEAAAYERANRGPRYEPLSGAVDDERFPWFLYWEIAWLVTNNGFEPGQRLLDLGGSSSLFSCYMASRGLDVVTVDLSEELVANGDELAAATGWKLRNLRMDMGELDPDALGRGFDHVTSVCVFEHIPISARIDVGRRIRDLLVDSGAFSITFDYLNPSPRARISSPDDVEEQFVAPSGLQVRGNRVLHDNGLRYLWHPEHEREYTFGALFQTRG
jgi:Methyltransferase domain